MKKRNYNIKEYKKLGLLTLFLMLFSMGNLWADGSKDLYPAGKQGVRGYLRSSLTTNDNYPFANYGVHYVYANAGETITLASSAQGIGGNAKIKLYGPNGSVIIDNTSDGKIANRAEELGGPLFVGETPNGNKYKPIYHQVATTGVYKVEFFAQREENPTHQFAADANWTQPTSNTASIIAWDVSVINATNDDFIKGRVYTNVLNLSNGNQSYNVNFEGIVYVLTKDGYTYRVDNNGNNGIWYTFYVNNNGFVDGTTQEPLYKSLNKASNFGNQAHNPNSADTERHITHKMFYTLPSTDLPTSATGAVPGGETWLKNAVVEPNVSNVELIGVDGTSGQVSNKGGYVEFTAGSQGQYIITIESTGTPSFTTRTMTGSSTAGLNSILWDGKDGDGDPLPEGDVPIKVTVKLQGAEVHFPFIDMEYNTKGTKVELLDHMQLTNTGIEVVESDIVYWDDSDIPLSNNGSNPDPIVNSHLFGSTGISSSINGHIWGVDGTGSGNQFGDNKAIDTWTFIKGEEETLNTSVVVLIADLEIPSITPDKTELTTIGEEITYTIKAKNNGPSDVEEAPFSFIIPEGFTPESFVFNNVNSCGTENTPLTYDANTRTYNSRLDLPNGCEVEYEITLKVESTIAIDDHEFTATIMRPNDVTDPDATNPDINIPPTDPFYECENNGQGGECNNIKTSSIRFQLPYALEKEGVFNDENGDGFAQVGETITYILTVKNLDFIDVHNVVVEDPMLGGVISGPESGDDNNDGVLNIGEEWIYSMEYTVTQEDIDNEGVYNLAIVTGENVLGEPLDPETSVDPTPLDPNDPMYDPARPEHTFVPLKGRSLMITNPHIYQKAKNN